VEYTARAELLLEVGILGIVRVFRLFLGIQVIKIAKELVETVNGGQVFVSIAEMVLAELSGDVAKRFQQLGNGRIFFLDTFLGARQSDFQESRAQRALPVMNAARPAVQLCCA
jgi:hypothetical protein